MSEKKLEQLDVKIGHHMELLSPDRRFSPYKWPSSYSVDSSKVDPIISSKKGYTWHKIPLQQVPIAIGLVANHPALDGRSMVFEIEWANSDSNNHSISSKNHQTRANLQFIKFEHLIPCLSIVGGSELMSELLRHLKHEPLSLYCSAKGFFWLRKQMGHIC